MSLTKALVTAMVIPEEDIARAEAVFSKHYEFVWRLLRRLGVPDADADDAAQQCFMTFVQKSSEVAAGKERTFLYGTALRVAANARRSLKRRIARLSVAPDDPEPTAQPDELAEARRLRALLDELLALLPDDLRRVLVLAEIEQYQVDEIAVLEGIPTGTAASRLRRARMQFRQLLAEHDDRLPERGEA